MNVQDAASIVTAIMSSGVLVTTTLLLRRAAVISEYLSRIDTWTADILRSVDPTNSSVCADQLEPLTPVYVRGSTLHFTLSLTPDLDGSGSSDVDPRG